MTLFFIHVLEFYFTPNLVCVQFDDVEISSLTRPFVIDMKDVEVFVKKCLYKKWTRFNTFCCQHLFIVISLHFYMNFDFEIIFLTLFLTVML